MGVTYLVLLTFSLLALSTTNAHNITDILSRFPEYSLFNSYLSQTKVDGEINSRQTLTVLVINNGAMSSLAAKHPLSVIKNALRLHVLLDYFDAAKLHQITDGSTLSTTLYQTTGNVPGQLGSVNITDLMGGKVGFGSAAPGSALDSTYTKEVKKIPYNISVLEISQPIIAPGLLTASTPSASEMNFTAVLEKAGCKTFAKLIESSGVLKVYRMAAEKGLTVFAPSDEAFKAAGVPDLSKLTNAELVSLLQYHALASYAPFGTLKTTDAPLSTLDTNGARKFDLAVKTTGDEVTLKTHRGSSRVASTVIDAPPVCIFTVDSVLLPPELFSPSPAPAPEPVTAPSPASSPVEVPSSMFSPPAPPTEAPEVSPAKGHNVAEKSTSDNSACPVEVPALFKLLLTVSVSIVVSVFLS